MIVLTQANLTAKFAQWTMRDPAPPPEYPQLPKRREHQRPDTMWHISPMVNRESIREDGLWARPIVWFLDNERVAEAMTKPGWRGYLSIDIWAVDCAGLESLECVGEYGTFEVGVWDSTESENVSSNAWTSGKPIAPDVLSLAHQAPPEPEETIRERVDVTTFGSPYVQTVPVTYTQTTTGTMTSNHYITTANMTGAQFRRYMEGESDT